MSDGFGSTEIRALPPLAAHRSLATRAASAVVACLVTIAPLGCGSASVHECFIRNAVDDRIERWAAINHLSGVTGAVLASHNLVGTAANDPAEAARVLESQLQAQPEPDGAFALAELSYQAGLLERSRSPRAAMASYRDAAALAWIALADPAVSRPDLAVRIHNGAVARLIRTAQSEGRRPGRNWRQVLDETGIVLRSTSPYLDPSRIADLRVAADLRVQGMEHVYHKGGLGVPLVAHRVISGDAPADGIQDVQDEFLPRDLRTGTTAVVSTAGQLLGGEWRKNPPTLTLLDSFGPQLQAIGAKELALADDRTTPLVSLLASRRLAMLEWTGLLDSGFEQKGLAAGLYMSRPYEPGKIPVVFVHGLVSSPRAWLQTINELENSPELASRYQFWVFLYPTGAPIPGSARQLRDSLQQVRDTVDPRHTDRALDDLVLVGHSMGGVLSKMMVQQTGPALWNAAITVPQDRFKASPELKQSLMELLVFEPLPFVRRVVFIATPHRGSPIADGPVGWAVSRLVRRPVEQAARIAEIEALNGRDVISRELHGASLNAIGNLRTDSPFLVALDRIPIDASVRYHSIIPLIPAFKNTDGVVEYRSSHVAGAASEKIVAGTHFSQQDPAVTREIRRILFEHVEAELAAREVTAPSLDGDTRRAEIVQPSRP
jgi:pimeloyl-ACP methyl ester carboxylesterase